MRDIKTFLANLPHHPGVYQMLGEKGEVLYVGKAKDLKKRVTSYFRQTGLDPKTQFLVKQIKDIDITITNSENEAVLLECNLIKTHLPRYNILLRDDKSYPYIVITTHHSFPRIDLYRGTRKKQDLYFGPFPNATAARETVNLLQKIFMIRTCTDSFFAARTRPCLLYQIGRCTGPCVDLISKEDYAKNVQLAILFLQGKSDQVVNELQQRMEAASKHQKYEIAAQYRDQVGRLRQIQDKQYVDVAEGDADIIGFALEAGVVCIQLLSIRKGRLLGSRAYYPSIPLESKQEEIISAFLSQHYIAHPDGIPKEIIVGMSLPESHLLEEVLSLQSKRKVKILTSIRGDRKKWLQMASINAKQSLATHLFTKTNIRERVLALQKSLNLSKPPQRVECFDISHSMGEATVASCVVFDQNGAVKSDYRRFNITGITPGDDIAAMHQAIFRRFKRLQKDEASMPDIVLIDGGKAQLATAAKSLAELEITGVLLIGVAKGVERKPGFEVLHQLDKPPMSLPPESQALHFIQQIRDEAHRFAITGHRNRRDKARRQSSLEFIPGIGAKKRARTPTLFWWYSRYFPC